MRRLMATGPTANLNSFENSPNIPSTVNDHWPYTEWQPFPFENTRALIYVGMEKRVIGDCVTCVTYHLHKLALPNFTLYLSLTSSKASFYNRNPFFSKLKD